MGFNPIKKLKKVVKKAFKGVLDIPEKIKDTGSWMNEKAKEGSKNLGRMPGKMLKPPKMAMPQEKTMAMPDEEEIKRLARRKMSGSGSRASTVLTTGL